MTSNWPTYLFATLSKIVTDQLRSYPAKKVAIPELADVKDVLVKASVRMNNRAENCHQPTCERERRMRGGRDPGRAQALRIEIGTKGDCGKRSTAGQDSRCAVELRRTGY